MIPKIRSQRLRRLLEHYLDIRGTRRLPARGDIDAVCLGPVLPIIWVSEFEPASGTFRYRLAGEEINEIWGMSVAGHLLSDFVSPDRFEVTNRAFRQVLDEEAALVASGPIYRCTDRIAMGERLVLPLSSDGKTADGLLGATERDTMVDFDKVSMSEQKSTYIPLDELARHAAGRAARG